MAATVTCRAYTGASAGTESSPVSALELCDIDALMGGSVDPGSNSFERWLRLRVDVAPDAGVTSFWFQNEGELPAGVVLKFGVTDTPATPVATISTIATTELVAGRRYIFDTGTYESVGEHSRYLVIQAQVAVSAASGDIDQQTPKFGWSES